MWKFLLGVVAGILVGVAVVGYVATGHRLPEWESIQKRLASTVWRGRAEGPPATSWTSRPRLVNGVVEVTAWGAASKQDSQSQAHAVALALRTARHLAFEQLAEYLRGAQTSSRSHYHEDMLEKGELTARTTALVRGAKVVSEEVKELADGSVRAVVTLRYPLATAKRVKA
jgi:hypothetical protein